MSIPTPPPDENAAQGPNGAGAPAPAAVEAFCAYLRQLEVDPDVDWEEFSAGHGAQLRPDLDSLLEQYERVTAILERLQPTASFSVRLRQHYGDGIDPGISLSGDGPQGSGGGSGEGGSRPSGRVLARLSAQDPSFSRYEHRQEIARGGMGAIQEVWDTELRRTLAMKVVLGGRVEPGSSQSSEEVAERRLSRFLEEAQITGQLDHPGIVPVHDIGIDETGRVYFTMQLIDGHDLRKVFELARLERREWNLRRVISVFVRVCEAMAYAHAKGVVHRDLKPANIMVGAFGEAYVMDWGLAKVIGSEAEARAPGKGGARKSHKVLTDRSDSDTGSSSSLKTLDGDVVGTPAYMAPEQARGKLDEVGVHSDTYAMGAMLYHLLCGHAPYEPLGEKVPAHTILDAVRKAPPWPLRQVEPDVDGELAAICEKAMAREPSLRYESMMALGEDLRAWVEGRGVGAYTTGVWYETRKWMARNMLSTIALGSIAFLIVVSIVLFIYLQQSTVSQLEVKEAEITEALANAELARADADEKAAEAKAREQEMKEEQERANAEAIEAQIQRAEAERIAGAMALQTKDLTTQRLLATVTAYRSSINAAAFSMRLDELEAVRRNLDACEPGMRGWEWHHLDLGSDPSVDYRVQRDEGVTDLAVGDDGKTLLTYGFGLRPKLWDSASKRLIDRDLPGPTFFSLTNKANLERWRCDLSPSGKIIAMSNPTDRSMLLINAGSGEVMRTLVEHEESVTGVAFSPGGEWLASCSEGGSVVVIETFSGRVAQRFEGHAGACLAVAFSPDARYLVSGGRDRRIKVWDLEAGQGRFDLATHHTERVVALDWAPDGKHLVSASSDGSVAVWSATDGSMTSSMHGHRGAVHDVVFSHDSRALFTAGEDRTVRMWSADTGKGLRVFNGHQRAVRGLVRLAAVDEIASCSYDGTLRWWDARWDPSLTPLPLPAGGECTAVGFDPDGRRLLARISRAPVAVIDADRARVESSSLVPGSDESQDPGVAREAHTAMAVAAEDGRVAVAYPDRRIEVFDEAMGNLERVLTGFGSSISRLEISADGSRLAVGGPRRRVFFVDLETGEQVEVSLESSLAAMAVSPDGSRVVTAQSDESLRLWDPATGKSLDRYRDAHSLRITALAFSADGKLLASASTDRTARIWRVPELELVLPELAGHNEVVTAVAFSPTEPRLVTGTASGSLRVWNLDSHDLLLHRAAHDDRIHDLVFSLDGKRLASCAVGREVKVWESDRGEERYNLRFGQGTAPR